jgi:multiple sugar transport system substrate-binding protein
MTAHRRFLSRSLFLLAVAGLLGFYAAGSSSGANQRSGACGTAETETLSILDYMAGADSKAKPMGAALASFAKLCPNIRINRTTAADPGAVATKYETSRLAGKEPDIVITNLFDKTTSWAKDGATIPVTKLIKQWRLKFKPDALKQWTATNGQVQAFPFEGFSWPVWYNTAIFKKAGVGKLPRTIDDLIAAATKIRAAGFQPLAIGGSDWTGNKLFSEILQLVISDQQAINAFQTGKWDTPQIRRAIALFVRLRDAKVFADNAEGLTVDNMDTLFFGGKAAMMNNGSWAYAGTPAAVKRSVVVGGFPLPSGSSRNRPIVYTGYTSTAFWVSPNGAEKLDAVRAFITHFYKPEVLAPFVKQATILPAAAVPLARLPLRQSALDPLYVQASKLGSKTSTVVLSDTFIPTAAGSAFERATSQAFSPGTSVDAIIKALEQAYR